MDYLPKTFTLAEYVIRERNASDLDAIVAASRVIRKLSAEARNAVPEDSLVLLESFRRFRGSDSKDEPRIESNGSIKAEALAEYEKLLAGERTGQR